LLERTPSFSGGHPDNPRKNAGVGTFQQDTPAISLMRNESVVLATGLIPEMRMRGATGRLRALSHEVKDDALRSRARKTGPDGVEALLVG